MVTLVASAARTASGDSGALSPSPIQHPETVRSIRFVLNVTAAATDAGDTLDVFVQQGYDGTNFDDMVHFTQVLGNGGAKTYIAEWFRSVTPESEMHAPSDAAIAAGVVQGSRIALPFRVKWVIVDVGGDDASFTFSVTASITRD